MYRSGKKTLEGKWRKGGGNGGLAILILFWSPTFGAAKDMDVAFFSWTLEKARYKVAFLRYMALADRADAGNSFLGEGMAVGTAEYVAGSRFLAGEKRRFQLLSGHELHRADGTDSGVADVSELAERALRLRFFGGIGKKPVGEREQRDPYENE